MLAAAPPIIDPSDPVVVVELKRQLQFAHLKIQLLEERLRLQRIQKYGPASEKLSDTQLELLEEEPGVSNLEVAAESARFGFPELRAGLTASTVTAHAVHVMGRKIAFELLMLCENITPQRAYELGLVNRVVPEGQHLETAMSMAGIIAKWTPEFVGQTKRTFHRAASLNIEQALDMARDISVMMARLPQA